MKRGEIYYIYRRDTLGSEIAKARPAVIISNDTLNATSEVVEVIYLTTQPKKEMPTHVLINATGCPSTALCEQIDTVSVQLIGDYCGLCTEEELRDIDLALLRSLGIEPMEHSEVEPEKISEGERWLMEELGKMKAERDRYAKILDVLLEGKA